MKEKKGTVVIYVLTYTLACISKTLAILEIWHLFKGFLLRVICEPPEHPFLLVCFPPSLYMMCWTRENPSQTREVLEESYLSLPTHTLSLHRCEKNCLNGLKSMTPICQWFFYKISENALRNEFVSKIFEILLSHVQQFI